MNRNPYSPCCVTLPALPLLPSLSSPPSPPPPNFKLCQTNKVKWNYVSVMQYKNADELQFLL